MKKPFDIGNTIVSASVSEEGRIININTANKKHGYVLLTPVEAFGNNWYDKDKVRHYRNSFLSDVIAQNGYGLEFDFEVNSTIKKILPIKYQKDTNILRGEAVYEDLQLKKYIFIPPAKNRIILLYETCNISINKIESLFRIKGKFGIIRASYAQITENGPIPLPVTCNVFTVKSPSSFSIVDKGTESCAIVSVTGNFTDFILSEKQKESAIPLSIKSTGKLKIEAGSMAQIALIIDFYEQFSEEQKNTCNEITSLYKQMEETKRYWKKLAIKTDSTKCDYIINRNFAYSYGCCCLKKYGAMITDHMSLPLTWNRDNYFMFKLIESAYKITGDEEIFEIITGHIKWLFSHMTNKGWGRSHLVNGKMKDRVFQFDQQCYPILELYDCLKLNLEKEAFNPVLCFSNLDLLSNIILEHKGKEVFLFETEENPADDPVLYPYHFSTQILAWKTFEALHEMNKEFSFSEKKFDVIRDGIKKDILRYMITTHNNKKIFCYTTDLKGNFELYHDANDLPFALAPLWQFIDADENVYSNTVKWAFSKENRGFYPGKYGGLGSDHAKGHWPLGDSQLLAISLARIIKGNNEGCILWDKTMKTLMRIMQKDGLFSESVFPDNGNVYTRYWFAWPGAVISWLCLLKYQYDKQY